MLLQNIRAKIGARLNGDGEAGFTLIELLVVMLILGILAAIALPSFFNQKDKAGDAEAKSNAHSAQIAMETCATDNNNDYSNCSETELTAIESTLPDPPALVAESTGDTYTVTIVSDTDNTFSISRNNQGEMTYTCTGGGGCPSDLTWAD